MLVEQLIQNISNMYNANDNAGNVTWVDCTLVNIVEELLERIKKLEEDKEELADRITTLEYAKK